eukprot:6659949-Pyramimonas_sp.AAC.1
MRHAREAAVGRWLLPVGAGPCPRPRDGLQESSYVTSAGKCQSVPVVVGCRGLPLRDGPN